MRRFLALLMVLALVAVATGCGGDDGSSESADGGDNAANSSDDSDDDDGDSGSSGPFDLDFGGEDDEELSNRDLIEVIQEFWEDRAEDFNSDYETVPDERIGAVPGEQTLVCQGFDDPALRRGHERASPHPAPRASPWPGTPSSSTAP